MSASTTSNGLRLVCAALIGLAAITLDSARAGAFTLDSVRAKVIRDHADVAQLSPVRLDSLFADDPAPLLIDVREAPEYAVSHIGGAQRADPGITAAQFLEAFTVRAKGRPVVFYCSVGVRSSILAEKVQAGLRASGSGQVYNLDGGIFGWHNEKRPLVDAGGPTDFVHPYDSHWGKLLIRRELATDKPRL